MGRRGGCVLKALVASDGRLELVERDTPAPAGEQVLVEVAASGVNRADLLQAMGRYPPPRGWPPDIPGLEFSGRVVATGDGVHSLGTGARVFGIVGGGAHATHVVVPESLCVPVPEDMELLAAGAIPEVFVTAHDAMLVQCDLRPGERVLIHGVGSGVGTAAVQLARAVGAVTVGTSRTPEKLKRAAELGLDEGIVASDDMAERIGQVDVVVDLIGGPYVEVDMEVCRTKGRIIVVGLMAGPSARLDLGMLMRKRVRITGTTLRARPDHEKALALARFQREVVPLFSRGLLSPVIDKVMPLGAGQAAYDLVGSNQTYGKVVLSTEG